MSTSDSVDHEELRTAFMNVYNNVPLEEREATVLTIEDEPVSWKYAYREIAAGTDLGKRMLEKLRALDII